MDIDVLENILDGREKPTNLSFTLLKDITENFSEYREIGHGGFSTVYKGVLPNGNVAVKRIKNSHSINEALFYREVDSLLNIEHKNVVRFLGFCASTYQTAIQIEGLKQHIYAEVRERLLCFEYISNGSLQKYITDELRGLEWNTRYGIIRGICEGLYHLHKEKKIFHMDLKPDNILLDNDMAPKITDFGLSRLDEKTKTMSENRPGTFGYCAPEYLHQGKMSFKSDMYSLGAIIIELVTGEKLIPNNNNNNVLRRWRHRWKKSGKETPLVYQQVAKCIEIGLLCQEHDPSKRPFIWEVIHDIREIEGINGKISNAYGHSFGQIIPYSEDDMLGIEPLELHFPSELNNQVPCALQLTNETDSYIAFNIQNMSPLSYCTQPQKDIMPPRSRCTIEVTMQLQGKPSGYMHRANELTVWSTKVNDCLAVEDITTNMFINEAVNAVDEVHLDVVFDAQIVLPQPSVIHSKSPELTPMASGQPAVQRLRKSGKQALPWQHTPAVPAKNPEALPPATPAEDGSKDGAAAADKKPAEPVKEPQADCSDKKPEQETAPEKTPGTEKEAESEKQAEKEEAKHASDEAKEDGGDGEGPAAESKAKGTKEAGSDEGEAKKKQSKPDDAPAADRSLSLAPAHAHQEFNPYHAPQPEQGYSMRQQSPQPQPGHSSLMQHPPPASQQAQPMQQQWSPSYLYMPYPHASPESYYQDYYSPPGTHAPPPPPPPPPLQDSYRLLDDENPNSCSVM